MNRPLKILFDENIGKPLVLGLGALLCKYHEPPTVEHIQDFYGLGRADDKWIPHAAQEGFILITCDRGKRRGGPKLPRLCKAYGITHVLVSGTLHHRKQFEKARAIVVVWPQLVELKDVPGGSCYVLRAGSGRNPILEKCG